MRRTRHISKHDQESIKEISDRMMSVRFHLGRKLLVDIQDINRDPFVSLSRALNAALHVAFNHKDELEQRLSEISCEIQRPIGGKPEDRVKPDEPVCEPDYIRYQYDTFEYPSHRPIGVNIEHKRSQ